MLEYEEEIRKKLNQINKEDTTQVVDEKASSSTLEEDFKDEKEIPQGLACG